MRVAEGAAATSAYERGREGREGEEFCRVSTNWEAGGGVAQESGGHVSGFLNYRVSRKYPRKCCQLLVSTMSLKVHKSSKLRCRDRCNFVITMPR